jgi:hypothetical protein
VPEKLVFVSHSSADVDVARATVKAIESALKISARNILCSSVDGYRLAGGAPTSDTLRTEISSAVAFAAILTPRSIASSYVLFELGARWGARKHICPLLARGATQAVVPGPLSEANCLDLMEVNQAVQFIEELAAFLNLPLEPFPSFRSAIDELVARASQPAISTPSVVETPGASLRVKAPSADAAPPDIRLIAQKKMKAVLKNDGRLSVSTLARRAGISVEDATEYLRFDPDVAFVQISGTLGAYLLD